MAIVVGLEKYDGGANCICSINGGFASWISGLAFHKLLNVTGLRFHPICLRSRSVMKRIARWKGS